MLDKNNVEPIRDSGRAPNKKKRIEGIFISVIILAILVGAGLVYRNYLLRQKDYKDAEEVFSLEYTHDFSIGYLKYLDGLIRYSKDGAIALDAGGKLLWNLPYEIQEPIISQCGNYFAIAKRGAKELYIINQKGNVSTIKPLHNINDIEISNQGVIAVLMEENDINYITVYDINGEILVEKEIDIKKYGYPVDIDISDDGTKLTTSFISITSGIVQTTISFYNYSEVGKTFPNKFVGGMDYTNLIIPRLEYINNNLLCAYADNGFILYSIRETPEEVMKVEFENKIHSILYNEKYVGAVIEKSSNEGRYRIQLYDLSGKSILDISLNYEYKDINLYNNEIVMNDENSLLILNINGKKKFSYSFENNIYKVLPIADGDKYYIIEDLNIKKMKLVE